MNFIPPYIPNTDRIYYSYRKDLLKWFIDLQLSEYVHLFHEAEDVAWIDKLDRRYAWFKKHLLSVEEKFGAMFPVDWELSEQMTVEFCSITRYCILIKCGHLLFE